jgi:hypothetical protein
MGTTAALVPHLEREVAGAMPVVSAGIAHADWQAISHITGRAVTRQERDWLVAIISAEVYHLLTELSGWTPQQYQTWLAGVIDRLLVT